MWVFESTTKAWDLSHDEDDDMLDFLGATFEEDLARFVTLASIDLFKRLLEQLVYQ